MKLNLGSGKLLKDGFTNVDILDMDFDSIMGADGKKAEYVKADIRELPFKDNTAEYVEMMSVIEHIPFLEVLPTMQEIHRVMKPEGKLVLLTDNFDGVAIDWIRAVMAGGITIRVLETVFGNQEHEGEFHKSGFNPNLLYEVLNGAGFKKIEIQNIPQNAPVPQFGTVPAQPNKFIRTDQLYARAKK